MKEKKLIAIILAFIFVLSGCSKDATEKCEACGENIAENSKYCSYCGESLNGTQSTTEPTITPTTEPTTEPTEEVDFLTNNNAYELLYGETPKYGDVYQRYLEDMILNVANAFNTAQLGSYEAQISIGGLIPTNVYSNETTADNKMGAIYNYFTNSNFTKCYTLNFDSKGNPYECEIKLGNIRAFVEYGIECDVFVGTWESFELNPSVTTFESVCQKLNFTPEVVVGYFSILETYDIEWLDEGDSETLLDSLK